MVGVHFLTGQRVASTCNQERTQCLAKNAGIMSVMKRLPSAVLAVTLCIASFAGARESAPAVNVETEWMSVVLAGRKVGHARVDRETTQDRVITRQQMHFELGRGGIDVAMSTDETHEETSAGVPLAFTSISRISGLEMRVEGRRVAGDSDRFAVKSGAAGSLRDSELTWPAGALLAHGVELKLHDAGTSTGATIDLLMFQPLLQEAVRLHHEVIGPATLDLPGGHEKLIEVRQTMAFPGGDMVSRAWMDGELQLRRMTMDVMGQELELIACDQACAEAPNQPAEILTTSLVASPRALSTQELGGPLVIEVASSTALRDWPGIDGQRLESVGANRYRITSRHPDGGDAMRPPGEADLARTDWLNFDAPPVKALLAGIDLDADLESRMQALQRRVFEHIDTKSLRVGYASASDAARMREGDCTEHALLLAALGRSAGVATRVVNGLAYSEDYGGGPNFVPHAWVAAWTGERWQAFDAALPGANQLRLAVHADDGDPWRFYSGLDTFGAITIESVEPAAAQ